MRIQCPNCPAAYELDDGRVPPSGLSIKCPKCKTPFTVHRPKPGEGKAAGQKVPLPGTGAPPAAKPQPARSAATGKQMGGRGAVPLPGMQGPANAAPAPTPAWGQPLAPPPPDSDPFAPPAGAVPLPGLDGELPVPSAGAAMGAPAGQPDLDAAFAPPPPDSGGSLDDAFPVADDTALTPKRQVEETDLAPKASADELPPPSPEEDAPSFDFVEPAPAKRPAPPVPRDPDPPEMLDLGEEQPKQSSSTGRAPPPVIAPTSPRPEKKKKRPAPRTGPSPFRARNLVLFLLLAAVGGGAAMGVRAGSTPSGLFWRNDLMSVRASKPSATTLAVVAAGQAKLGQGTFSSAREALGTAAQLLGAAPDDDDARSFFVLCAAELKVSYGQGGADWDQAKRVVEKIRGKVARSPSPWATPPRPGNSSRLSPTPIRSRGGSSRRPCCGRTTSSGPRKSWTTR